MKRPKIIIFRHGESEANLDGTIYGSKQDHLTELTEKGKQQARDMCPSIEGHVMRADSVLLCGSPYLRSRQTSKEVQDYFVREHSLYMDYHEDPCIREQEWGNFFTPEDGDKKLEDRKRHSYFFYRIPDGESGADVYSRMQVFRNTLRNIILDKSTTRNAYDLILISAHSISLLIFMMCELGWDYQQYEFADWFDNCDYVVLEDDEHTNDSSYYITHDGRSLPCKHKKA